MTQEAARTTSIPTLKRKIAVAAAIERTSAGTSTLENTGASKANPKPCTGTICLNSVCSANQIGEVEDDADHRGGDGGERAGQRLVAAQRFDVGRAEEDPEEARREGHPGREQTAERAGDIGESAPASRKAAMKPTNCTTMISGPGVVSAMPSPSSISPGFSQ